jgi:hypothetical protein
MTSEARVAASAAPAFNASLVTRHLSLVYLRLAPGDIALVKFLFESYEEVGIVRTVDRERAVIVVLVIREFLPVARAILDDLHTQIEFTEIDAPPLPVDDWLMREIDA